MARMIEVHSAKYQRRLVKEIKAEIGRSGVYYVTGQPHAQNAKVVGVGYVNANHAGPGYMWARALGEDRSRVVSDLTAFVDGNGREIVASREP